MMRTIRIQIDSYRNIFSMKVDGTEMKFKKISIVLFDHASNELYDECSLLNGDVSFNFLATSAKSFDLEFGKGRNRRFYSSKTNCKIQICLIILCKDGSVLLYLNDTLSAEKAVLLTADKKAKVKRLTRLYRMACSNFGGGADNVSELQ